MNNNSNSNNNNDDNNNNNNNKNDDKNSNNNGNEIKSDDKNGGLRTFSCQLVLLQFGWLLTFSFHLCYCSCCFDLGFFCEFQLLSLQWLALQFLLVTVDPTAFRSIPSSSGRKLQRAST